ncbi:MAG: DUF1549 domain-containing protein [Acidobacteria bacterium]|nr:DUF1549 domain-containing protein [Acidobacteriota bacterium]
MPAGENAIDTLVRRRLAADGLQLNRAASPAAWLRRVSLDLTGLPPTPAEVDAFVADPAYERAADRLLASPRYGERMAMDWLDVARYADTHGFNNDAERSMWRWRDWVIESFNRNLPYHRFITEQLAGDLLPKPTLEQRIATGFGRNHVINSEGGIIDEEYRVEYVVDRVRTLGMAWMGLTLECARCHDHKYDPISQRDHYRLYAFFNNVPELGEDGRVSNAPPMIPAPTAPQQARLRELEAKVAALENKRWPKARLPKEPGVALMRSAPRPDKAQLEPVEISKRSAFTMSAWLNPDAADTDAPLLSAMDFARNPAATTYGNGIELRLVSRAVVVLFRDGLNEAPWTLSKSTRSVDAECTYDEALVRNAVADETALLDGDVIAAPLAGHEAITLRGAVQLRSRGPQFDENHLRWAAAAGLTAGLAFDAANRLEMAEAENARLRRQLELQHDMVGESPRMRAVYKFIARVAPAPTKVLITGESGTDKELVPQAIHRNSPRAQKPFVAINCASLGEALLESELFGHEKGAFTGAVTQKRGKLELAHTGTVFLDELGEMPLLTQAKLLRVLQQRQFERLGGTRVMEVDLRVVAATNRNLSEAVKAGTFRQDLFYRLNVVSIDLPLLRDRREDVPLLAAYFITRFAQRMGRHVEGLSPEARACLLHYDWPGNVRELENAMERAVVMGTSSMIQLEDLPELVVEAGSRAIALGEGGFHAAVVECKRRLVLEALDRAQGNVAEAAKLLGLNSNYLHRLMNNLDLRAERS